MLIHTKTKLPYLRQLLIQDSIQFKTLPVSNPFFSSIGSQAGLGLALRLAWDLKSQLFPHDT